MKRKTQTMLWILIGAAAVLLVGVLLNCRRETEDLVERTETGREIVLLCCYQEGRSREALEMLAETYMTDHPGTAVTLKYVRPSDFQKEICLEKDGNNLSDLIICDNVMTPALVSMGILQDLSGWYTVQRADTVLKTAYRSTMVNGKPYSVPFTCDPYVIFYNESYYEKNGIKLPETMEEFVEILKSVRTLGNYNFAFAGREAEDLSSFFLQMVYLYGGNILDLNGENSQGLFEMLEMLRDTGGMPQDLINWNQQDVMKSFSEGLVVNAAARISSMTLLEQTEAGFSWKMMEIPYKNNQAYLMHGENIGITTDTSDQEVMDFLEYLISEESIRTFCEKTNKMSVCVSYENCPGEERGLDVSFFQKQRYQGMEKKSYSSWFVISGAIEDCMISFLTDSSMSAQTGANRMQETVRAAIMER